jgi:hypothetical protein
VFAVPLVVHPDVPTPIRVFVDLVGVSIAGAEKEQAVFEERQRVIDAAAIADADAGAEREREAEEVARAAIE